LRQINGRRAAWCILSSVTTNRFTGPRLARHLAIAVAIKLAALAALWWWFERDAAAPVDADRAAARLASPAGQFPPPPGAFK
jgi:hypothetical protein